MNVTNKERTIHFFTKGDKNCGSSRQRAFLVAEKMTQQGIKTIVHEPSNELISKTRWPGKFKLLKATLVNLLQIKHGDIIFLQRTIYNKYFLIFVVA
ncbi:MAG: hypothetical protein HY219_02570, partial [Candidatus Staskawiczbacteria bacterium]|nr:hypothetical protein [Candidatus Staskawiczbacteria bacterium]